jgi:hypothetical protein
MYLLTEDNRVVEYYGKSTSYGKVKAVIVTPNSRHVYRNDVPDILTWIGATPEKDMHVVPKQEIQDVLSSLEKGLDKF